LVNATTTIPVNETNDSGGWNISKLEVSAGNGFEKLASVGVLWFVEDIHCDPFFHDLASVHDGDAVADLSGYA
jgi:hypothetical protein